MFDIIILLPMIGFLKFGKERIIIGKKVETITLPTNNHLSLQLQEKSTFLLGNVRYKPPQKIHSLKPGKRYFIFFAISFYLKFSATKNTVK